jgi:hypothetical protein
MPCGTCGQEGHNTVRCPTRKAVVYGASAVGTVAGLAHGCPGGGTVAYMGAQKLMETDGQKHYAKYGKKK